MESLNLKIHSVTSIVTMLTCCQELIVLEEEAPIVLLAHFTLTLPLGDFWYSSFDDCENMLKLCEFAIGQSSIGHPHSQFSTLPVS